MQVNISGQFNIKKSGEFYYLKDAKDYDVFDFGSSTIDGLKEAINNTFMEIGLEVEYGNTETT